MRGSVGIKAVPLEAYSLKFFIHNFFNFTPRITVRRRRLFRLNIPFWFIPAGGKLLSLLELLWKLFRIHIFGYAAVDVRVFFSFHTAKICQILERSIRGIFRIFIDICTDSILIMKIFLILYYLSYLKCLFNVEKLFKKVYIP